MLHHLLVFTFTLACCSNLVSLYSAAVLYKLDLEKHVGVLEEAFLKRNNDELTSLEVLFNHKANVLGVTQI
jgi:hypothetical protein